MNGNYRSSVDSGGRGTLVALLATTAFAFLGCLDLRVPPNVTADGGPDAGPADAADVPSSSGGAGSGGHGGSGGGSGASDASSLDDVADAGLNGTGGRGSGGRSDAFGATGGTAGAAASGTGGTGKGGTAGSTMPEDAASKDSQLDSTPADSPPETPADAAPTDVAADAPGPNLSAGLVLYYPCEQLDGTQLRDQSGSGNHGTVEMGGGASGLGYRIEPGKIGNGLTLVQAGSGYVSMPPATFTASADLTIATWIKLTSLTNWQRLFDVGINANLAQNTPTGTVYMTFFLKNPNNKLGLGSSKDGFTNAQQITAEMLSTGTWRHIAVVIAGGTATIHVDGTAVSMINPFLPPQALGNLDYAFLGRSQFTSDPYVDAQIDEVRVYNRALSASEVQALVQYVGAPGGGPPPPN